MINLKAGIFALVFGSLMASFGGAWGFGGSCGGAVVVEDGATPWGHSFLTPLPKRVPTGGSLMGSGFTLRGFLGVFGGAGTHSTGAGVLAWVLARVGRPPTREMP
ncbi:MAG TPA: hypothetical protein EYF98_11485 [Planctomycetes bacterium]|nr:hypothetical protein [Planctomycetota bacterium]